MPDVIGVNGLREDFRVVGKPNLPGKVSKALATGVAKFGVDYVLPNMLHAKFLRSPYANARVLKVDISKAKALPGVVDIVTWEDEDIKSLRPVGRPWLDDYADKEGIEVAVIVVAENEDICEQALELLDIEWEILPHVVDILKGKEPNSPVVRPKDKLYPVMSFRGPVEEPRNGNVTYAEKIDGDVDKAMAEAENIIEYSLMLPSFASHMPNPAASVAWWTNEPYREMEILHIEGAVQRLANILPMYKIPIEQTVQEGLFQGGKYCDWGMRRSQEITPLLARRTGRPVRCSETREETFDFLMNQRYMYMKVGYTNEGEITAIDDYSIADGGIIGNTMFATYGDQAYGPYQFLKCLNTRQRMDIVDSNRGRMFLSGQHCPFNWDTATMAIYLISEKLGKDPMEIAKLNLHGPDSQEDRDPVPSFEACLEAGRKQMNWSWHPSGTKKLPDGRYHGSSFRFQQSPRHAVSGYECKLELRKGKVFLPTQGPVTGIFAVECNVMVIAEELGLEYDDIEVEFDYREAFTPVGGGSDGSTASAWAMKECAYKFKQLIIEAAAAEAANPFPPAMKGPQSWQGENPLKGHDAEELDFDGGRVFVKSDPSLGLPLAQAVTQHVVATYTGRPPTAIWSYFGKKLDTMNTAYCDVAVDVETGEVEILRFSVAADVGKVLRPTSLESQIDQVMYFSQGCQLLEEYVFDERTGVKLNNNMIDYKKLTMLDAPPIEKIFLETRAGNAVYGASGISHSLANTHLLLIAIHNAIGVWVDPPASPGKILEALGKLS
ncbi:MAG: molybdopterin-dependent oxidoreductase [Oscillospiraceae bacterium]|nr:molybdopterin-dependent oxidoreductase [Oscillospiraceae bacterium]